VVVLDDRTMLITDILRLSCKIVHFKDREASAYHSDRLHRVLGTL